jgi:hypothetical protein
MAEPATDERSAPAEPARPPVSGAVHSWRDFLIQLVIVTAGVLIALLLEGLVGFSRDRALVREARANILQELQDNLKEIDVEIAGLDTRGGHLKNALQLAEDVLARGTSSIDEINLGFSLAELNSASWRSAERTGALGLMQYSHVQALSKLYDFQDLYVSEQQQTLARLSVALDGRHAGSGGGVP